VRLQLGKENALKLSTVKHFVLDECDKMLEKLGECMH
jgi:superfamily II DNA/RNA helicase